MLLDSRRTEFLAKLILGWEGAMSRLGLSVTAGCGRSRMEKAEEDGSLEEDI